MAPTELFSVPIPARPSYPGGSVVCTTPASNVYLLTFTSPSDNRLTPEFIRAVLTALDIIEFGYEPGVVVTTSGIQKFYSNGLDLGLAQATPGFWEDSLYALLRRFLTYPMPTVAMINGHAFAGGIFWAMHHDYRVFTGRGKGFACVNELEFGAPLPPALSAIFRIKTTPLVYRSVVLEAKRFDAEAALAAGIVDAVGELDAVLKLINDRGLVAKGSKGSYGQLKAEMYKESIAALAIIGPGGPYPDELRKIAKKQKAEGQKWLKEWRESQGQKAKL
ncbi:putative carnitinyl-CoA dehydratase [Xylaria bambusicola]|uniref:putative carnitinyl-CoA dehydratase n=1 Tax=Xylaria bambusicola TaxID=326684 RepID=UPI002008B345|nr:putative carnitinyl-CoA dehydratase [Xylaria bambusicola]KAI0525450.1 putative carnitinyl-CoA dehydratase [Xylaria bambusicola]